MRRSHPRWPAAEVVKLYEALKAGEIGELEAAQRIAALAREDRARTAALARGA